jgi:OFA family oxalate/formate antiporter-like MFS transporter
MTTTNRWFIAAAGVLMQVALGAVYAWSVFRIPLTKAHGWTIPEVTFAFELSIFVLGFASFAGGIWMKRSGPRPVAFTAAVLYGIGTILAGEANDLTALYLSYGVVAGAGLGLGYIVPIATLVQWFPDRRGMITGLAVAGFGAGALVTAPVANLLMSRVGVARTFEMLGSAYFVIVFACAFWMRNPNTAGTSAGYGAAHARAGNGSAPDFSLREALGTWQWYALWLTLFLNTSAGIAIISQAAPMAQEISNVSAATAAGLVGLISIANGSGRLLWAWLSDSVGRRMVFLIMFIIQAAAFFLLAHVHQFATLSVLAFVILLCYGGGFGTMPAFATDYFGARQIGSVYGLMLTAWGFAAMFGPTLVARVREATGQYDRALSLLALVMLVSAIVPFLLQPPKDPRTREVGLADAGKARRLTT